MTRKLLFLCQNLPYPPDNGVKTRSFNTLRQLANAFEITALCFTRHKGSAGTLSVPRRVEALSQYGPVEEFRIPQEDSKARFVWDHLRSVLSRQVYTRYVYDSPAFCDRLEAQLNRSQFDVVHADSLDLAGYFRRLKAPIACTHHDVQSLLLTRRAAHEKSPIVRWYARHQAVLMRAEEEYWCPRVSLNVVVSDEDQRALDTIAPGSSWYVAPNGVDTETFAPLTTADHVGDGNTILFVGGATWFPNLDGMEYFATSILPLIRKRRPEAQCVWVGRLGDSDSNRFSELGVRLIGYVDDVRPFLRTAACVVVPLRVGGGTRIKILDAWAMGKSIVSTSIGCEGLLARDGENLLVRDDPVEFAESVAMLLADPNTRLRMGQAARQTAVDSYSWDTIGEGLRQAYLALAQGPLS